MTDTIKEIDFVTGEKRGSDLLPDFLKNADNLKTFIDAFIAEVQELYDSIKEVSDYSLLDTAYGNTLDQAYGERVNLERDVGESDESYRISLKSQIKNNVSFGSIPQIIDLYLTLTSSTQVYLDEVFPCLVVCNAVVDDFSGYPESAIKTKMNNSKAAGVAIEVGLTLSENAFQFAESEDGIVPANTGFSQLEDGSDGGQMDYLF